MRKQDFYPHPEKERPSWHENHVTKLRLHREALGISEEKITQAEADVLTVRTELDNTEKSEKTYAAQVKQKNVKLSEIEKRTRTEADDLRKLPGYTEQIGEDLGIHQKEAASPTSRDDAQPTFFITVLRDRVRIDWVKGIFHGVVIYCMRGNETQFTKLDRDDRSPFEDLRRNLIAGVPENRTYEVVYYDENGNEIGRATRQVVVVLL